MPSERIAIITGGNSKEAEVSRRSGQAVADALQDPATMVRVLEADQALTRHLQDFDPDVVMPIMHGAGGEDGTIQGYLEVLGYPYTGSGVEGSVAAMNKIIAKALFRQAGLPVAPDRTFSRWQLTQDVQALDALQQEVALNLGDALVVKPAAEGSAIGVLRIRTSELKAVVAQALHDSDQLLIEQWIFGRELTVGILEDATEGALVAFPVTEILTPKESWYDFEHRYDPKLSQHIIPANIPTETADRLMSIAKKAHRTLALRDFSRADFLLDKQGNIYLLEVNNIPGMTATSLYPDAALAAGFDLKALAKQLIANARFRHQPD